MHIFFPGVYYDAQLWQLRTVQLIIDIIQFADKVVNLGIVNYAGIKLLINIDKYLQWLFYFS